MTGITRKRESGVDEAEITCGNKKDKKELTICSISHTIAAVLLVPIATRIGESLEDPHPRLLIMVSLFPFLGVRRHHNTPNDIGLFDNRSIAHTLRYNRLIPTQNR